MVNQDEFWIVSMVIDSIEISLQELIIQEVGTSLVDGHIKNCTAYLEKILHDVILVISVVFEVTLDEEVLLGLLQESVELSVLFLEGLVGVEEMKSLNDIDEE